MLKRFLIAVGILMVILTAVFITGRTGEEDTNNGKRALQTTVSSESASGLEPAQDDQKNEQESEGKSELTEETPVPASETEASNESAGNAAKETMAQAEDNETVQQKSGVDGDGGSGRPEKPAAERDETDETGETDEADAGSSGDLKAEGKRADGGPEPSPGSGAESLTAPDNLETGQAGTKQSETEQAGTEQPGTVKPGTVKPETEQPGTEQPGTEQPETGQTEIQRPETEKPAADSSLPSDTEGVVLEENELPIV